MFTFALIASLLAAFITYLVIDQSPNDTANTISVDQLVNGSGDFGGDAAANFVKGQPAPNVPLKLWDGSEVYLAAFSGKVIVLNFWASTCTPCKKEMPELEQINKTQPDVVVIGVGVGERQQEGEKLAKEVGVTYRLTSDPTSALIRQAGGTALPHTVFIGTNGEVTAIRSGALTADVLTEEITRGKTS